MAGSEVPIIPKAKRKVKRAAPSAEIDIEVSLYLRRKTSSPGLPSIKDKTKTPLSQRKHLSHPEFEKLHGADPNDVETVREFAAEHNLKLVDSNLARRLVRLKGKLKDMAAAFGVTLSTFEHDDETFRGHEGAVHVPEELKDVFTGVFGLSSHVVARPHIKVPFPKKTEQAKKGAGNLKKNKLDHVPFNLAPFFTPTQVAQAYNFPTDVQGEGQTIGIIQLGGGYVLSCLDEYFSTLNVIQGSNLKTPEIIDMDCGGQNNPGKNSLYDLEVCGNIEMVGAVANKAKQVIYFSDQEELGSEKAFLDAVAGAVHDSENSPAIISISWGSKEESHTKAFIELMDEILLEAFHKGITVCAATGDTGSSDCSNPTAPPPDKLAHVDFPASSPWVLACGGTILTTDGSRPTGEVVWNEGRLLGATGGGVSDHFDCPDYQKDAGILPESINDGHIGRGIPDVAGNASRQSGYALKINQCQYTFFGGTSAVAPLWAALIAILNKKLNTRLGFINDDLYRIDKSMGVFKDITEGNNQNIPEVPGYSAGPGWDACTGLGTPNGEKLYQALRKNFKK